MPVQLKILAIILAFAFFIYTIRLVRQDKAEIRHMLKWLILALVILIGAVFSDFFRNFAHFMGITTLTSLSLYILVGLLLLISLRYQMSLISAEKQIKNLVQELSILKKEVQESETQNEEENE